MKANASGSLCDKNTLKFWQNRLEMGTKVHANIHNTYVKLLEEGKPAWGSDFRDGEEECFEGCDVAWAVVVENCLLDGDEAGDEKHVGDIVGHLEGRKLALDVVVHVEVEERVVHHSMHSSAKLIVARALLVQPAPDPRDEGGDSAALEPAQQ